MDPVRPLGSQHQGTSAAGPRLRLVAAAGALALLGGVLTLGGPSSVQVAEVEAPAPLTDTSSEAVAVVQDFLAALRRGDAALAAGMVGDDWELLALPAMPFRLLPPGTTGEPLADALQWYTDVVGVGVAPCAVVQATFTATRVSCDLRMTSSFSGAARIGGRSVPVAFEVVDDRITSVLRDHLGSPALTGYCHWIERTVDQPTPLFDTGCLPVLSAASAALHPGLAASFLADSRTGGDRRYRSSRSGVAAFEVMIDQHNRSGQPGALAWPGATATGFPGLVGGGPPPALADFLDWSKVMYRIAPGACSVDARDLAAGLRVECPDATWSGPLISGLALAEVRQPATFVVDRAAVRSVEGGTPPALDHAFTRFCEWVHANRASAPLLFSRDCTPVFTAEAAGAMLMTLALYTDDAR